MKCRYCGWEGDESRALRLGDSQGEICSACREIRREYAKAALMGLVVGDVTFILRGKMRLEKDNSQKTATCAFEIANAMMEQEMKE